MMQKTLYLISMKKITMSQHMIFIFFLSFLIKMRHSKVIKAHENSLAWMRSSEMKINPNKVNVLWVHLARSCYCTVFLNKRIASVFRCRDSIYAFASLMFSSVTRLLCPDSRIKNPLWLVYKTFNIMYLFYCYCKCKVLMEQCTAIFRHSF